MPSKPIRLAWICDSSDAALAAGSKSAFVTRQILPFIARWADIRLYTDSSACSHFFSGIAEIFSYDELEFRETEIPSDVRLFQFEDRPRSAAAESAVGKGKDVVWFHDWHERSERQRSLETIASHALSVAFSSERNIGQCRASRRFSHRSAPPLSHLSYPIVDRGPRRAPQMPDRVAYCGLPLAEDQAHTLFRVIDEFDSPIRVDWMISREEESEARRILSENPRVGVELHFGRTCSVWSELLERAACAAHLHFSAYGDHGPALPMSLMRGVPVLVSDFGDAEQLPGSAVLKIETGAGENQSLRAALKSILDGTAAAAGIGTAGRTVALEKHDARAIAAELNHLFERLSESVQIGMNPYSLQNEAVGLVDPI